ncbi:iron-containing alcohol dehydrogenase [Bacillota bacterium LX-D]|nr:iron-containing alcohol dehydrogenase [Bacillota bacterium LX-D]
MPLAEQVISFFMPPISLTGPGSAKQVGAQMQTLGVQKALIVTDEFIHRIGMADDVLKNIEESGRKAVFFDGVEPNPTDHNVEQGLELFKKNECDCIVSVGGGSSHDCAKGIGIVASNGGKIHDYEGLDQLTKPMAPMIAVNTTAGTAAEMTRFAIITDTARKVKMAIIDWRCTPIVAINDPLLMMKKPPELTAATGMDALTHAVEAYVSTAANPLTDSAAIMAIKLISKNLRTAVANGDDYDAREAMAYAQYLAGMAFNNASLGYVHAMAHQLGGFYNLPHGVCNAILLPHVERFNLIANPKKFVEIAEALGEQVAGYSERDGAELALESISQLADDIGIPAGLSQLGVKEEDLQTMAENAMKDATRLTNPRKATLEEIIEIYKSAM